MLDEEINEYLMKHNFAVDAQACTMKVFNTSPQIIDSNYDFATDTMTIITPKNVFKFKWKLGKIKENN